MCVIAANVLNEQSGAATKSLRAEDVYRILVWKSLGRRRLERPRRRNVQMELVEVA